MKTKILFSTLIVSIVFLASIEQAAAFKYEKLPPIICKMGLMDESGKVAPMTCSGLRDAFGSPEVQACLDKGKNITVVGGGKSTTAYCWEPEPPVKLDPRTSTKRAAPLDAAAERAVIACWNRNGSVTRKGQTLNCVATPQELRHSLQRVGIKEEGVK